VNGGVEDEKDRGKTERKEKRKEKFYAITLSG
jgi:hypothetical protein